MNLQERIQAFSALGQHIADFIDKKTDKPIYDAFQQALTRAEQKNRWFTSEQMMFALGHWAELLTQSHLEKWVSAYSFKKLPLKIGVIQAGNLPLVGFHDFLSVLISGHFFVGKASSKDDVMPQFLSDLLIQIELKFKPYIVWQERISDVDAIIATGSDNSARYFEYYFANKPNIIRKNRSSWAIITGKENAETLSLLGEDIFRYYGLGCRNVSKLFVPKGYNFDTFFKAIEPYRYVYNHHKYANNYDYNQSVYLLNQVPFLQNGFVILKEDIGMHSPLSVVYFEYYSDIEQVYQRVAEEHSLIQCVADQNLATQISVLFGQTQQPKLNEYADQVDVLDWLSQL